MQKAILEGGTHRKGRAIGASKMLEDWMYTGLNVSEKPIKWENN